MKSDPDKIIMTVAEFLAVAQTSEMDSDQATDEQQGAKMKDARAKRDEEWGLLANQVVGGETAFRLGHEAAYSGEQGKAAKLDEDGDGIGQQRRLT